MTNTQDNVEYLFDRRIAAAACGDAAMAYELGVAYSTGTAGADFDLIDAHKWFNLAAAWGNEEAPAARSEISEDMTAREIATAQRAARDVLAALHRRAA
jgi:TPR repeat protein